MTDQLDQASKLEQQSRELALKNRHSQQEKPLVINGIRSCLDCEEPVEPPRIKLVNAVRCIMCQVFHEATQKHQRG